MDHAKNSPIKHINRAIRRISLVVISTAVAYKAYGWWNYLSNETVQQGAPGAFRGETVEPAERKSKYEGAGDSHLGRCRGDRLQAYSWFTRRD